jgi:hypothetical protein
MQLHTVQSDKLRDFSSVRIEEDCKGLEGHHENELFYGCSFKDLRGLTLKDCDLNQSKFETDRLAEAKGFTLTLDCHSFRGVQYSPLLFDLMLYLLSNTEGNDEKRQKLRELLGDRAEAFDRLLGTD